MAARLRELIDEHGRSSASRAGRTCRRCFAGPWAKAFEQSFGTNDPERGITPRQCVLEDEAIKAIWDACPDDDFGKIVKLLLLSGCRSDEIGALRWDEIKLKTGMLIIHEGRVKNRHALRLPLPAPALDVLRSIPPPTVPAYSAILRMALLAGRSPSASSMRAWPTSPCRIGDCTICDDRCAPAWAAWAFPRTSPSLRSTTLRRACWRITTIIATRRRSRTRSRNGPST